MMDTSQNATNDPIRNLRKEFFAFRNGIIADKLRAAGDPPVPERPSATTTSWQLLPRSCGKTPIPVNVAWPPHCFFLPN